MNVLPFIFSFLIIFMLGLNVASDRKRSTQLFSRGMKSTFQSMHHSWSKDAWNDYDKACKNIEKERNISSLQAREELEESEGYFRDNKCVYEEQKFNLSKFEAPTISILHPRYKAAARLFKTLYGKTAFYREGLEDTILKALLTKGEASIYDLFEKDPKLDAVFYKILKGTSTYVVGTNKGYPSLFDYFRFNSSNEHFTYEMLSKPVLESLVGSFVMEIIEKEERQNNTSLSKVAFEQLLHTYLRAEADINELLSVLQFDKVKKGERMAFIDDNDEMILRK